jgi:hypothetical protein
VDAGAVGQDRAVRVGRQLLNELQEELGLEPACVSAPSPLCVVEDPATHVCDLGMAIVCALSGPEVLRAHAARGNGEYPELRLVALAELAAFVADEAEVMVSPAPILLRRAGLL